ncbi:MAG: bacterioferritin [Candidatus Kryptoniota bacterium]
MEGNKQIIEYLNLRLAEELTAVNQYIVHAEMCDNWGYKKLHESIKKRAIQEMKHAERIIERILFLEGTPNVSKLNQINIGKNVEAQLLSDYEAEKSAVKAYNDSIGLAAEKGDNGTRELFKSNLQEEEKDIDWIEAQLDQIKQMGIQNYLSDQL